MRNLALTVAGLLMISSSMTAQAGQPFQGKCADAESVITLATYKIAGVLSSDGETSNWTYVSSRYAYSLTSIGTDLYNVAFVRTTDLGKVPNVLFQRHVYVYVNPTTCEVLGAGISEF